MSLLSKLFGLVMISGLSLISIQALGMTPSESDTLYSDSITLQRSSAEIPSTIGNDEEEKINAESESVVTFESSDSENPQKIRSKKIKKPI